MKKIICLILIGFLILTGCATGSIQRIYRINATGYAEIKNDVNKAKVEALNNARTNLVSNVARFFEYMFHIDSQIEQEILYLSKIGGNGIEKNVCYVDIYYDMDLYKFIAKHGDLKNIYSWELIGLESVYSDYITSNKPIGIWAKDQMIKNTLKDPLLMSSSSIIPFFSGNFLISKPIMGGFFTAAKTVSIFSALLSDSNEKEIRMWGWIALGITTALDVLSVFSETDAINKRLQLFQNAILMGNKF